MNCPKCGHEDSKVLDTRTGANARSIRRRRQCLDCGHRFTTLEEIMREGFFVIKKDGRREEFDHTKILNSLRKATEKRPIEAERLELLISEVTEAIERDYPAEVPSRAIGEQIMEQLKQIDHIAYVRFACVYKDFKDLSELAEEIKSLKSAFE
jgi:transcriptional repressor NrdR